MNNFLLTINTEFFRATGVLTFTLYVLEALKEGFVSFFFNPEYILILFVLAGLGWLFTPDNLEKSLRIM